MAQDAKIMAVTLHVMTQIYISSLGLTPTFQTYKAKWLP